MHKKRSDRTLISFAGAVVLSFAALSTSGCASSQPRGATSFAEEWQQIRQGIRDGTALSSRGQEISRSLDSRFDGPGG